MKIIPAASLGLVPGKDISLSESLGKALAALQKSRDTVLAFTPGEYHFYPQNAPCRSLHISNHVACPQYTIAFLLEEFSNFTLDGAGSRFIFHTELMPFCLTRCNGVTLRNFSIDYARPAYSEGEILAVSAQQMTVRIDPARYPWQVHQNKLWFSGEGFAFPLQLWLEMDGKTGAPAYGTEDLYLCTDASEEGVHPIYQQLAPDVVQISLHGNEHFFAASRAGNRLILRHHPRTYPAVFAHACSDISIENAVVHHAVGMGFLAQQCRNIQLHSFGVYPTEKENRAFSACADATHFVNCAGKILLSHCRFEKQLDDAVNIHGVYSPVQSKQDACSLSVGWGHADQIGTAPCAVGDEMTLMDAQVLRSLWHGCVKSFTLHSDHVSLHFDAPLPDKLPAKAVLENQTNTPQVQIQNCVFRHNRARGILLTCKQALVQDCLFETAGAALYMEGEARYWYEAGATQSICLRHNRFVNCAYIPAWGAAPITVDPKVSACDGWYFHAKLVLEENEFSCFDRRLLFLRHVGQTSFVNNRVLTTTAYPPLPGERFDEQDCGAFLKQYTL